MPADLQVTPELEERIRSIVRDEVERGLRAAPVGWSLGHLQPLKGQGPREWHHGAPFEEIERVAAEMEALRRETVLPHEEVEALFEEHRREFGRG